MTGLILSSNNAAESAMNFLKVNRNNDFVEPRCFLVAIFFLKMLIRFWPSVHLVVILSM